MADYVIIKGSGQWDGRHPFDWEQDLTVREWGWVKKYAGYLPLTLRDGFEGGDPQLVTVYALIALHRNGTISAEDAPAVWERLIDGSRHRLDSDEPAEDDDAGPPALSSGSSNGTNGAASPTSTETPQETRTDSGITGSAISPSLPTGSPT